MPSSKALTNRQIVRAALIVLVGFLTSGILGIIRTAIISATFGTGNSLDAFYTAQRIPELVFVLVAGGALGSSFIPVFSRLREKGPEHAWQLASAVMTLSALAAALLGLVVILAAPWLVGTLLAWGKPPEVQALTTSLMRIMMVTPAIFAISGLLMGILHAHQRFWLPSLAISMNSLGIIFGALVLAPLLPTTHGLFALPTGIYNPANGALFEQLIPQTVMGLPSTNIYGLALGAVLSAVLHLAVQLPGLRLVKARLRPLFDWRVRGVIEVLALMGPRVIGLAVTQINFLVNAAFSSAMIAGSYTALTTAWTLMFFVLGIIGQSIGSAVFPSLSALAAEDDLDGFKERLSGALRGVLFLAFPASVGLIVLGTPVIALLYQRGAWTAESTEATAWALGFFALGIAGHSLLEVLSRAFYALEDTLTPVVVGTIAMISNIVLSLVFIQHIGEAGNLARGPFAGLALANSLTTLLEGGALWWLLRRRIGNQGTTAGLNDAYVLNGAWRALLASLGMGLAVWLTGQLLKDTGALIHTLAGGLIGGAVFFALSLALALDEARSVPRMVLRRVRR